MRTALQAQANRLLATRLALGFESQAEFCKEVGLAPNVYNPFETAKRPITINAAIKIRNRFRIPLDWTICGDPAFLPAHLARKIEHAA